MLKVEHSQLQISFRRKICFSGQSHFTFNPGFGGFIQIFNKDYWVKFMLEKQETFHFEK
jgi:hypothetical protein